MHTQIKTQLLTQMNLHKRSNQIKNIFKNKIICSKNKYKSTKINSIPSPNLINKLQLKRKIIKTLKHKKSTGSNNLHKTFISCK